MVRRHPLGCIRAANDPHARRVAHHRPCGCRTSSPLASQPISPQVNREGGGGGGGVKTRWPLPPPIVLGRATTPPGLRRALCATPPSLFRRIFRYTPPFASRYVSSLDVRWGGCAMGCRLPLRRPSPLPPLVAVAPKKARGGPPRRLPHPPPLFFTPHSTLAVRCSFWWTRSTFPPPCWKRTRR